MTPTEQDKELREAVKLWSAEGRNKEERHGAINFVTSRHFRDWHKQEIAGARLASTYQMMTEYVDWCNDHSTELDDGAGNFTVVRPTFLGFRRFMNDKVSELSQTLKDK